MTKLEDLTVQYNIHRVPECPSPGTKGGGGTHSPAGEGVGVPNLDD